MQQVSQLDAAGRIARKKRFWGVLALFLAGTLGASILLEQLVSPVGDAIVAAARENDRQLTGLLLANASSPARYTIFDGVSYYTVKQNGRNLQRFIGRKVTLAGIVDPKTGSFQVSEVRPLD